ncbi:MAG: DUF4349 domain-containing protein [Oscillospiraceae bacterium]|jgi:hypothetical protein|nr:DUF4349 domain-containing protein [Oscillospiraceae bacterium]
MKRTIPLATLLAALLVFLASCSADNASLEAATDFSLNMSGISNIFDSGGASPNALYDKAALPKAVDYDESIMATASVIDARKIIWDASMDIEAEDAAGLHARLAARAAELGGYEHTNNIRHYEQYSTVSATFKIPPQHLQNFMAYAGDEGKIINSSIGSDDITEGYYDTQLRLETKRHSLDRYFALLSEAKDIDEILRVQRIIDGIIEEIEAMEGRLRVWDILTDMATVSVSIRQENDPVTLRREINWNTLTADDMGYLIKSGFIAVIGTVLAILQWVAISLLVTAPLWISVLIILWSWRKRRKQRRAAMNQAEPEQKPDGTDETEG